jgi:hypothetical protein
MTGPQDEYQVKAAFLYSVARFVEWPAGSLGGQSEPLLVCVAGVDPFGRALAVRRIPDIRQAKACPVLFVGSSQPK